VWPFLDDDLVDFAIRVARPGYKLAKSPITSRGSTRNDPGKRGPTSASIAKAKAILRERDGPASCRPKITARNKQGFSSAPDASWFSRRGAIDYINRFTHKPQKPAFYDFLSSAIRSMFGAFFDEHCSGRSNRRAAHLVFPELSNGG